MPAILSRCELPLLGVCGITKCLLEKDLKKAINKNEKEREVVPKWELYSKECRSTKGGNGEKRLKRIIQDLEKLDGSGFKRSAQQKEFHLSFIIASLKKIYGSELKANLIKLFKQFNIGELKQDVIVITPRRFGKTTAIALFVAVVLKNVGNFTVVIHSPSRRNSKKLLWKVAAILNVLTKPEICIKTMNMEMMEVSTVEGTDSTCISLPMNENIGQRDPKNAPFISNLPPSHHLFLLMLTLSNRRNRSLEMEQSSGCSLLFPSSSCFCSWLLRYCSSLMNHKPTW